MPHISWPTYKKEQTEVFFLTIANSQAFQFKIPFRGIKPQYSVQMTYRGVNFGHINFEDNKKLAIQSIRTHSPFINLPYNQIKNCFVNKNEIAIEMNDEIGGDDRLCQMRFYVDQNKAEQMQVQGQDENPQNNQQFIQKIYKNIKQKAKIESDAIQSFATLPDIKLLVPRGKYTVDLYQTNFRLHGTSASFLINYNAIGRGFVLPGNESQINVVFQLVKPISHGQTTHYYIVFQFQKDSTLAVETKMNEEMRESKYEGLQKEYNSKTYEVFIELFNIVGGVKMIQPGKHFEAKNGLPWVKCNVKAQTGLLYMLKQSIMFLSKLVLYFKIEDISTVKMNRLLISNKQFDMILNLKNKSGNIEFLNIEKTELDSLIKYFEQRDVKIIKQQTALKDMQEEDNQDESQDDDFVVQNENQESSESQSGQGSSQSTQQKKKKGPKTKGMRIKQQQ